MSLWGRIRWALKPDKEKAGELSVPGLKIDVRLYTSKNNDLQKIVDDANSAALFKLGQMDVIADHNYQGNFSRIQFAEPNKTIAKIKKESGTEIYLCVKNELGYIKTVDGKRKLYDSRMEPVASEKTGLCIYTCVGKSDKETVDVFLTFWKKISG